MSRFLITKKYLIKSPILFVYVCVQDIFSFWMHSIVNFSHFVFNCQKHNYFCSDFLLGLNLSFVAKLEVGSWILQMDYFVFWWLKPIAFHLILHTQRSLVITNRDFHRLLVIEHWQHWLPNTDIIGYQTLTTLVIAHWQHWSANTGIIGYQTLATLIIEHWKHWLSNPEIVGNRTLTTFVIKHRQHWLSNTDNMGYRTLTT